MIKLPEPVELNPSANSVMGHSDATLKQAVRDALELAFQVAGPEDSYKDEHFKAKADSADAIRALIKEIEA